MYRILKFITVFLLLFNFQTNLNYKPVPPGAGEGDVAANILFLVDSSASMGAWIVNDGLDAIPNSVFDSSGAEHDRIKKTQIETNKLIFFIIYQ